MAVPPLAIGKSPVIFVAAFTKVVDVVPVPPLAIGNVPVTLVVRLVNVVDVVPVPPLAIGNVPVTSDVKLTRLDATFTKSEPFQATNALNPEATVTPVVGPAPRITTEPVPALMTM